VKQFKKKLKRKKKK